MRKIEALIKPFLLEQVREGLLELGIVGITVSEIRRYQCSGNGNGGLSTIARPAAGSRIRRGNGHRRRCGSHPAAAVLSDTASFDALLKLEIVVRSEDFNSALDCIRSRGRIDRSSPDPVRVQQLCDVIRIRTTEHGETAI